MAKYFQLKYYNFRNRIIFLYKVLLLPYIIFLDLTLLPENINQRGLKMKTFINKDNTPTERFTVTR